MNYLILVFVRWVRHKDHCICNFYCAVQFSRQLHSLFFIKLVCRIVGYGMFYTTKHNRLCELRQLADAACQTGFDNESIAVDASLNVHVEDNPALEEYLAIDIETEVNPTLQDANVQ